MADPKLSGLLGFSQLAADFDDRNPVVENSDPARGYSAVTAQRARRRTASVVCKRKTVRSCTRTGPMQLTAILLGAALAIGQINFSEVR
jgi:hypothetical protein